MSSLFKNNLNIPDLFIFEQTEFNSIEFCFLFLTSDSFRNKSPEKQLKQIHKLRNSLGNQIENIFNKDTSKNKTLLLNFNPDIHNNLLNLDYPLGDDFIFIIQHIVKSHTFIIAENKNFSLNINKPLNKNDNIIIVLKKDSLFSPIFSSNNTYSFQFNHPSIKLIESFNINKDNIKNTYNIEDIQQNNNSLKEDNNNVVIVDDSDIFFEDFDDEITIKYNNKSFAQKFSDDEISINIQNLLSSIKHEKGSGKSFLSLINNTQPVHNTFLDTHLHPVTTVSKHFEDYQHYIDSFNQFKNLDPNKPFIRPVHYHENKPTNSSNLSHNNDVVRNSFTSSFPKLDNTSDNIDYDDCIDSFSKTQLETILKYHKISTKISNKTSLCNSLIAFNFLEHAINDKINDNMSLPDLHSIFKKHKIAMIKSHSKSKDKLVQTLIKHNITDFISPLFSLDELKDIAIKHNIPHDKDFNSLFHSLIVSNLLLLSKSNQIFVDSQICEIEDTVTAIQAATNPIVPPPNNHLEIFRTLPDDDIYLNGFYLNGDKTTHDFRVFDIENYFNILHNIKRLIPTKCSLYYFDSTIVQGTVVESIQNNNILKIKTANNKFTYYNLKNFLDNNFYLYTEFYEGYKYNKNNLSDNIFFYINNYNYDDMIKFISLNLPQYLSIYHNPINDAYAINRTLSLFNTSFTDLNHSDLQSFLPYITASKSTDVYITASSDSKPSTKNSQHPFLQFNNNNISDLHKMILMQKQNYFQIIYDVYHTIYATHSFDNLDTNISFSKNSNIKKDITHQHIFNSFNDLNNHKKQIHKIIEENNDIDLTDREYLTNIYIQNINKYTELYKTLLQDFNGFYHTKHEKVFFEELRYSKKTKLLEGSYEAPSFINSDPNNQHTSLTVNVTKHVINEELENLATLVGIHLTTTEVTYVSNQTKNIFTPFLTKFKLQKNPNSLKNQRDKTLWNHFANTVIYCAFITLIAQYKYNIDNIFNKCKSKFSLHGFPMDDQTDKTFTQYISCVIFSLFGNHNKLFASEQFIDSQITAIIRLIFQHSPALKTVFTNTTNKHNNVTTSEPNNVINDIKPFFNSKSISETMKKHIKNSLTQNFKIHSIDNSNTNSLLTSDPPLQIVSTISTLSKNMLKLNPFENIRNFTIPSPTLYQEPTDDDIDQILDQLTVITDEFKNWNTFSLNNVIQNIIDTFVIKTTHDDNIDNYYHIFKFNSFYTTLLANERFTQYKLVFSNNLINFTTNIPKLILNIFLSIKSSLEQIFNTNDIYTFLNVEMNPQKRDLFVIFVNAFKTYLTNVITNFNDSNVNLETLRNKAEVLREIEKQEKLTKYDNLEDDQMFIIMELEKQIGVTIDIDAFIVNNDDDTLENETLNQLSEEDDIPE